MNAYVDFDSVWIRILCADRPIGLQHNSTQHWRLEHDRSVRMVLPFQFDCYILGERDRAEQLGRRYGAIDEAAGRRQRLACAYIMNEY